LWYSASADVLLEFDQSVSVGSAGSRIQYLVGTGFGRQAWAGEQVSSQDVDPWLREQYREITQPLGLGQPPGSSGEREQPQLAIATKHRLGASWPR
jgi:hypothetical protein